MKKTVILIIFCFLLTNAIADPWDNLSYEQAVQVSDYLNENPFILEYCDCCDIGDVILMKVVKNEIVPCEWDNSSKSVKVTAIQIGKLERNGSYPSAYRVEYMNRETEYIITMNYTFVYSDCGKWAVPFFKLVDYDNEHVCCGATRFPDPDHNAGIKDQDYIEWFKEKGIK